MTAFQLMVFDEEKKSVFGSLLAKTVIMGKGIMDTSQRDNSDVGPCIWDQAKTADRAFLHRPIGHLSPTPSRSWEWVNKVSPTRQLVQSRHLSRCAGASGTGNEKKVFGTLYFGRTRLTHNSTGPSDSFARTTNQGRFELRSLVRSIKSVQRSLMHATSPCCTRVE